MKNSFHPIISTRYKNKCYDNKKAYDELEQEGYIITRQGKGSHVAPKNTEIAKEQAQKDIEKYIEKIVDISNRFEINENDVIEMFKMFYREEM